MEKIVFSASCHNTINVTLYLTKSDKDKWGYWSNEVWETNKFLSQFDIWRSRGRFDEGNEIIQWEYPSEIKDYIRGNHFKALVMQLCGHSFKFEYHNLDALELEL